MSWTVPCSLSSTGSPVCTNLRKSQLELQLQEASIQLEEFVAKRDPPCKKQEMLVACLPGPVNVGVLVLVLGLIGDYCVTGHRVSRKYRKR
jgi:hypothetical protein